MVNELMYSTTQAAVELGLHPVYVRLLCEGGAIKAQKTSSNGHWRISVRELRRYKLSKKGGKA